MRLVDVENERYCPRLESWRATWGAGERVEDRCAECGAQVVYNPTQGEGPVRLVCINCLTGVSGTMTQREE